MPVRTTNMPPADPALLLEGMTDACYALDLEWRFTFVNASAEAMLGAKREQLLGRIAWDCFPEAETADIRQRYEEAAASLSNRAMSFSVYNPRQKRWFAVRALPTDSGLIAFFHGYDEVGEDERRFRALVEKAMDGISLVDERLNTIYRSPSGLAILGYAHEPGGPARELPYHPDDFPVVREAVAALGPSESTTLEFRAKHSDGHWLWLRGTFTNRLADPSLMGIVVNYSDITEKKHLRDETERKQLELAETNRQLELRIDRLATLHRVHLATARSPDVHSIVSDILRTALQNSGATGMVYTEQSGQLACQATHDPTGSLAGRAGNLVRDLTHAAVQGGKRVTVDLSREPSEPRLAQLAELGVKGVHVEPFSRSWLSGALVVLESGAILQDPESYSYFGTVTGYIATSLETVQLLGDLKRSADDYSALARFGQQIETITDTDELARHGLRELLRQLRVDYATLAAVEGGFAVPRWRSGDADAKTTELLLRPIPLDRGVVAQAVKSGEPVVVNDYLHYRYRPTYLKPLRFTSVLALPIDTGATGQFVFVLASRDERSRIDETAVTIAGLFAKRMANAFERVTHLNEVKATREETFRALGLALEYRDYETKGHTDRVVRLAAQFGLSLGLDSGRLEALRWGAYLHDVGKLSVPDHVLLKAGPLNNSEFSLIKQHPVTGEEIARDVSFLPLTTHRVVRHHHEKWDGSGYPDRLAGTDIPLEARLFALVDVYDALTSDRPYRPAWTKERAITHMREQSGKHFDPDLLNSFLELVS